MQKNMHSWKDDPQWFYTKALRLQSHSEYPTGLLSSTNFPPALSGKSRVSSTDAG